MLHATIGALALLAAAPLDASHSAVLDVLSKTGDAASCDAAQQRKMAAAASIRRLGRLANDDVVLAQVGDSCICGAQNCPYYAIRLTPGNPRVLLAVYAIDVRDADRARPLPGLIVDAHDSAMVADETTYAFSRGSYVAVANARVRGTDHARKPNAIPVHFAPGASSAALRGTASLGWYDVYTFGAEKGQRVSIAGVSSRAKLTVTLFAGAGVPVALRPGMAFVLPKSGAYRLQVEADSEDDAAYTLTLAVL